MKRHLLRPLFIVALFSTVLVAPSAEATKEPWYWQFALGYSFPGYPSVYQPQINALKTSGASHLPIYVDLGFYWPVGEGNTIIGPAIQGNNDSYEQSGTRVSIIQTGLYFSAIHSFGDEPGHGFFIRGDAGLARIAVDVTTGALSATASSNVGLGGALHTGYGIMIGADTRLVFSGHFNYRRVEGESYTEFGLAVGPNF